VAVGRSLGALKGQPTEHECTAPSHHRWLWPQICASDRLPTRLYI